MLKGIHVLLTYMCNFGCDHCFLHCGPEAEGTFTIAQLRELLDDAANIETVDTIYFEGGEPMLYYPLMLEGIRLAREHGFKAGVVSNSYWANSTEDAEIWLRPLAELGITDLSVSDDQFHYGDKKDRPPVNALAAAKKLGIPVGTICIEEPIVEKGKDKGAAVIGGGALLKGRAVEKLTEGLPTRPWEELKTCPHEELVTPGRIHVDAYGNTHICQGISMGNMWKTPLSTLDKNYDPQKHPICRPLIDGGPAQLAREYNLKHEDAYVDECHFCYLMRSSLIDKFPEYLAPRQVYGLE